MPALGATVAIIQAGQILLTKREDFEVWCIPGGAVDPGESVAQAAMREALEETGLEVHLTRLVGVYSKPGISGGSLHLILFAAQPVGGQLQPAAAEVLDVCYFAPDALPEPLMFGHRQFILDALNGVGGVARAHTMTPHFKERMTRQELYEARDRSGLSRQQFYIQYLQPPSEEMRLEVGEIPNTTVDPEPTA